MYEDILSDLSGVLYLMDMFQFTVKITVNMTIKN